MNTNSGSPSAPVDRLVSCRGDSEATVESVYDEFWKGLVEVNGELDLDAVKRELFDFWQVMQRVPKVYCYITGHQASKLLTDPDIVCALADEYYERLHRESD